MKDKRIQYALDNFIEEGYFLPENEEYLLTEEEADGKTGLSVLVSGPSLCIADFDKKKKCAFLRQSGKSGMTKSSDHVVFCKQGECWKLCIIEMKTSVGTETWREIKLKTRATYLNAMAVAVILGFSIQDRDVDVYTTFESEKFGSLDGSFSPVAHKPLLGRKTYDAKKEEWDADRIKIRFEEAKSIVFRHHRVQLKRNKVTGRLEGKVALCV